MYFFNRIQYFVDRVYRVYLLSIYNESMKTDYSANSFQNTKIENNSVDWKGISCRDSSAIIIIN